MVERVLVRVNGRPPHISRCDAGWVSTNNLSRLSASPDHASPRRSLADAVKESLDGREYFTEPDTRRMTMSELLAVLHRAKPEPNCRSTASSR